MSVRGGSHSTWRAPMGGLAVVLIVASCSAPARSETSRGAPPTTTMASLGTSATNESPPGPWPITGCGTYDGTGCADPADLVDLDRPIFSNPTEITNPYFPIIALESVVFLGSVDDETFRSETTLLPGTATVVWDGEPIEVRLVQYLAYADGRITEVAIDRYAQADDGSVWYFGEDVYDYADGSVVVTEGTWLAGRDGPPAMIMPGDPQVGDVFRPETVMGVVFEEVTVSAVDETFDGPFGPVDQVLVASELHLDGTRSDKLFAPGYGEFYTGNDHEVEALAVAARADAATEPEPVELRALLTAAWGIAESARLEDWDAVDAIGGRLSEAWAAVVTAAPARVADAMDAAAQRLDTATQGRDVAASVQAAIDIAQAAIDVRIRYAPQPVVDIERIHLHAQQLRLVGSLEDPAGVAAEVAALEWIHQRIAGRLTDEARLRTIAALDQLRIVASAGDLAAAGDVAARLAADLNGVALGTAGW